MKRRQNQLDSNAPDRRFSDSDPFSIKQLSSSSHSSTTTTHHNRDGDYIEEDVAVAPFSDNGANNVNMDSASEAERKGAPTELVITEEEQRAFDRIDRLNGLPGKSKRARTSTKDSISVSSASGPSGGGGNDNIITTTGTVDDDGAGLDKEERRVLSRMHHFDQPFSNKDKNQIKKFDQLFDEIIPYMAKSRTALVNDELIKKRYNVDDVSTLYHPVDIFVDPLPSEGNLYYVARPLHRRLMQQHFYTKVEIGLRNCDLQWQSATFRGDFTNTPRGDNKFTKNSLPAGFGIDLSEAARFIDSSYTLDVWNMDLTLPSMAGETRPPWINRMIEKWFSPSILTKISIKYVGVATLDAVVDDASLFQLRFVYIYIVLHETRTLQGGNAKIPGPWISEDELERLTLAASIPQGETHIKFDRHNIIRTDEPSPIFGIPFIYVGRYYFAPTPADNFPKNSLVQSLKDAGLLWNISPIINELQTLEELQQKEINQPPQWSGDIPTPPQPNQKQTTPTTPIPQQQQQQQPAPQASTIDEENQPF